MEELAVVGHVVDVVHGLEAVGEPRRLDLCNLHLGRDRGHVLFLIVSIAVYSPCNPPLVAIKGSLNSEPLTL